MAVGGCKRGAGASRPPGPATAQSLLPAGAGSANGAARADPMALMLALTAIIEIALGETRDGIVLLVALVPVLGVDVVLEARSRRALAALAAAVAPRARVVRDGVEVEVPRGELVAGDV